MSKHTTRTRTREGKPFTPEDCTGGVYLTKEQADEVLRLIGERLALKPAYDYREIWESVVLGSPAPRVAEAAETFREKMATTDFRAVISKSVNASPQALLLEALR